MTTVGWTHMAEGTKEDYEYLGPEFEAHVRPTIVPNLVNLLKVMEGPKLGYQIDRYQHSLQSATRALRNDETLDMVVGALLHDVADGFAPENHSSAAASILEPYVDERTHWVVRHHGLFQGYYYFHFTGEDRHARERYKDHPYYQDCVDFCANWDQPSFDPNFETKPLAHFEPKLRALLDKKSGTYY